jgi:hypothetical protein
MTTTQAGQGLGRVFNAVPAASGNMFSMRDANAVSFLVLASGAATLAVTAAKTFGGSTANWTPANGFGQPGYWYQNTVSNGTAAWTKQTASWSTNTLTLAGTTGYASVVTFYATQFADGYRYIQVSGTNTTYVVALLHDLSVERIPANLVKLGA